MSSGARFAYVQSRLQARHGRRLGEPDWRALEATADLAGYLQAARSTFFSEWIHHLAVGSDTHQIERSLRLDWGAYCREVGGWLPPEWRACADWLATFAWLPMITHLARDEPARRWMRDDPELAPLAISDLQTRRQTLAASRYGELAGSIAAGGDPLAVWSKIWLDRCDEDQRVQRARLRELADVLRRYLWAELEETTATPARRREVLTRALALRFRRWAGSVGAAFAHVTLVAIDAERLRAGLVLRAIMPVAGRPSWA